MPTNECIPIFETADRVSAQASSAVAGKKFVTISGNKTSNLIPSNTATQQIGASDPTEGGNYQVAPPSAGGAVLGVATWDAAVGEKVGVIMEGVVPVIVGTGGVTAGQRLQVDATGAVVTASAGMVVGIALTTASAAAECEVKLLIANVAV
jgi:predicted RecA/RadA family phage recombinase